MRRLVVDLETAVGERQPVNSLSRPGHRLRAAVDQSGEVRASEAGCAAGQRDRRCASVARDGDRQGAVRSNSQSQGEAIEFDASNLHLGKKQSERIETDLAGRRCDHRAADGVPYRQMTEPEVQAPRIIHKVGWAKLDRVADSGALLQARCDSVVQRLQINRPVGEAPRKRHNGEERDDHCGFGNTPESAGGPPCAKTSHRGGEARTGGAVAHAAHGGPRARTASDIKPTDQTGTILRGSTRH